MCSGAEVTAPLTAFRVPMRLAYLRAVSLCCALSRRVSKHLRSRLFFLGPRDQELHLDTVDFSAESFDRLGRVDLDRLRMNGEAQPGQQVDRELSIPNGLEPAASHPDHIVDVCHTSDLPSAEISNSR